MSLKLFCIPAALAATAALVSLSSGPASAEWVPESPYVVAGTSGSEGYLTGIHWTTSHEVHFGFIVKDTKADGDHAEARVQSITDGGTVTSFSWHSAVGWNDVNSFNTYVSAGTAIKGVRIEVCRKGDSLPDICDTSSWAYRP